MKHWCLMTVVLIGSIFTSPLATGGEVYNSSAEMAMSDAILENWLNVETDAGSLFEENITISGFATREPVLLTWEMFDSRGEDVIDINSGTLVNYSEGQHSTFTKVDDDKWNWTINIQRFNSLSCLCIIEFIGLVKMVVPLEAPPPCSQRVAMAVWNQWEYSFHQKFTMWLMK